MRTTLRTLAAGIALAACLVPPAGAEGLDILVTNDDGIAAPGLQTLAAVLAAAGHDVTVVAPADEQSGKGGSINADVFTTDFVPIVRVAPNQWAVSGTPSDAVNVALNILLAGDPPDLVVSGLNRGQNLGKLTSNTSGTMGAALRAALGDGIPAIATSVGILFSEAQLEPPFPSTSAAYAPAAAFVAQVIGALQAGGGPLLPNRMNMININFPVPVEDWAGVALTKLGDGSDLRLPFFDVSQGFPPFFPPVPIPGVPSCAAAAVGEFCLASVGVTFPPGPDSEKDADVDAHRADLISITPMNGDMTAGNKAAEDLEAILGGLTP